MARTFRRVAAASVLLLALPSAALAAIDDHLVAASTSSVSMSLFPDAVGSSVVEAGGTEARGLSTPLAEAAVGAASLLGTPVIESAEVSSTDETVSGSADEVSCAAPAAAGPVAIEALCRSVSAAGAPGGDLSKQAAQAELLLAGMAVDGSVLADLLLGSLDGLLEDLLGGIGDGALTDAVDQFTEACDALLPLDAEDDPSGDVPASADALLSMSPAELAEAQAVLDGLEDLSCSALLDLTVGELTEDLVDLSPLADALAEVTLLELTASGVSSEVLSSVDGHTAVAEQVRLTISGPSLDFLDDLIIALFEGAVDDISQQVTDLAGQEPPTPLDLSGPLADALAQIPLLDDSAPLLEAEISGGTATATVDRAAGVTTAGGELPFVRVTIAPSIAELLGVDPAAADQTVQAGETRTIGEGTPLESTISVGDTAAEDDVVDADSGMAGSRATTSSTSVDLLSGVQGGIQVVVAGADAGAFGASVAPATDPPALPRTGGGAAALAVLALASAAVLWRRRGQHA